MATVSQTKRSNAVSWIKVLESDVNPKRSRRIDV